VAIPAVMAFNYFTGRVEAFDVEMDNSSSELITISSSRATSAKRSVSRRERNLRRAESQHSLLPAGFSRAPAERFVRQCRKPAGANKFSGNGAQTMGIAVRNEGTKVSSNINVTPMVDVMLVLLIIFMVITPMLQNKVQIDMAKVDNATSMPDADKDDAIVVAVTRDGGVFLGQTRHLSVSLAVRSPRRWPTSPARQSSFAPMPARSTARWKTPLMPCAPPAWMMWACSRRSVKAVRAALNFFLRCPLTISSKRGVLSHVQ